MKPIVQIIAVAAALAAPLAAVAQTAQVPQNNQPLTRAQVRAELVELEKAGYRPALGLDPYYPDDIQAAERKVAAQHAAKAAAAENAANATNVESPAASAQETGFGGDAVGTSQAGARVETAVSSYSPPIRVAR